VSLLLDTHVLFWWVTDSPELSAAAREAIAAEAGACFVSAASAFEFSNKVRLGKFDAARELVERFDEVLADNDFTPLPVSHRHARLAGQLAAPHRDPFDRLIVAQALTENCAIVTADPALSSLGALTLW
jgi:PIN domain nuclease of toxin-antitoxin system